MTEDDFFMFHKEDLPSQAFPLMEEIRREGKLCDVTLKVGDHRISAHRIVLSATIPYFHAMFTHDMVEAKQEEITIKEIEASAMEAFVNFAYNGKVQISTANVQALLIGASFLHLHSIKQACCDFMEDRLQPHNAIGVRQFADRFMCSTLVEAANQYIYVHFVDVSKCNEFVLLDKEDLINIVSRNDLHVNTEEQVFEACMAWVNHDLDNRREDLPDLLVNVRMPLMTPQYLSDIVAQDELVKCSLQCRDLIDEAKDYHLMPERRMQLQTFRTRPRCCTDVVGIIYAVGGLTSSGDSISTVECFDPVIRRWQITQPMKTLRSRVGVAVLNGKLYAIGGYDGSERLNTVEVFDPESNHWKLVRPMNCKRSALGAAALDGKLYVCGGYDGVSSLSSVECYDPLANSWSMVSNMNKHRSAAGVTVLDGHIYALGGHDGLSIFDCAETYNKMKRTWTRIATMLSKRCRLGVAPINGKIVVCGGYNGSVFLKTVESYDPATNQWSSLSSMLMERSRVTLVANVGKLYAVGGYDGFTNLNTMELYDPETDAWSMSVAMCAHEGGVGVGVIPLNTTE